jgi:dihydroorotase
VHCENQGIVAQRSYRPAEAEIADIGFMLEMAHRYKLRMHFAHVSTAGGLELIAQAKRQGMKVTCETAPHYLYFTEDNVGGFTQHKNIFMKPPLRKEKDRLRLLEGIVNGEIDCIATDHAPHTLEHKAAGQFGIPMLDNYTHFVGWLMQHGVKEKRILELCCEFPGDFIGRYTDERHGQIRKGYVGSFTVVGTKSLMDLNDEPIKTKCGWSPFEGAELGNKYLLYANSTIVRGVPLKYGLDDAA